MQIQCDCFERRISFIVSSQVSIRTHVRVSKPAIAYYNFAQRVHAHTG
jgi:3-methyladenine DNA glycosylase/8-oxoguanine DNA glycosylase